MNFSRTIALIIAAGLALAAPANAQWQVPNHAVPIGEGGGNIGFNSAAPGAAGLPLISNGASVDPTFQAVPAAGIAAGAIGNTQLATAPANTAKCNPTSGTAALQDCTASQLAASLGFGVAPVSNSYSVNHTVLPNECPGIVQMSGGMTTITLPAFPTSNGFAAGCTVIVKNADGGRGKPLSNFPADFGVGGVLWPSQSGAVTATASGGWVTAVNPGIWYPSSPPAFFVDNGGSDGNDGLASGPSGAFATLPHCIVAVGQYQITRGGGTIFCKVTAGQGLTASAAIFYYSQAPIPFQIQSTVNGSPFTWNCPAGQVCIQFGDYGGVQLQDITFNANNNSVIFGHQYGIVDFETGITLNGNNGSFPLITCDAQSRYNVQNGLTYGGTSSLLFNACPGSSWNINNALIAASATLGRFFNATSGASVTFAGNVSFGGSLATSVALISGNAVVNNLSGSAPPGGAPTPTSGGQYCTSPC